MGNLLFMSPGAKPRQKKMLNNDAALIFTTDVIAALPTLPPNVQAEIKALPALAEAKRNPAFGELRAIDPLTGKSKWAIPTQGWQDRGGVLTTAGGLLFQGTIGGQLNVYDKSNGKLLKSIETGTSILAAPMTYRVKGVQYVAVMAAWGGGGFPYVPQYAAAYNKGNQGRLLVFKIGGGAVPIPPDLPKLEVAPVPPKQAANVSPAVIAAGQGLFYGNCALCHANQHRSITPDLRRMAPETHAAFNDILMKGLLATNGMPRWDDHLEPAEAAAIHAYLIDLQGKTRADELEKQKRGLPLDAPSPAIMSNF
jgi:quinohemoprotein ethanol dehydrogenase